MVVMIRNVFNGEFVEYAMGKKGLFKWLWWMIIFFVVGFAFFVRRING